MNRTSKRSSKELLQNLEALLKQDPSLLSKTLPHVAVLGIGNELRGDDAAGLLVVRALQPLAAGQSNIMVLDGGPAPENFTGALRRFAPNLVLLVDAAQMDQPTGVIRFLSLEDTVGLQSSTHTLPPHMLAKYLIHEFDCQVTLIGIQPAHNSFGAPPSQDVSLAVGSLVQALALFFSKIIR